LEYAGERWGFPGQGKYAHSGMLRAAMSIRQELEESDVLAQIYGEGIYSGDYVARDSVDENDEYAKKKKSAGNLRVPLVSLQHVRMLYMGIEYNITV
jgi:hypothetical protein